MINNKPFKKDCYPEPWGRVGESAVPPPAKGRRMPGAHGTVLLHKDQVRPNEELTFHYKFRFYHQSYSQGGLLIKKLLLKPADLFKPRQGNSTLSGNFVCSKMARGPRIIPCKNCHVNVVNFSMKTANDV